MELSFTDFIITKEASKAWSISTRAITYNVVAGRILGAIKKGNLWLIPVATPKPEDKRKIIVGSARRKWTDTHIRRQSRGSYLQDARVNHIYNLITIIQVLK